MLSQSKLQTKTVNKRGKSNLSAFSQGAQGVRMVVCQETQKDHPDRTAESDDIFCGAKECSEIPPTWIPCSF